MQKNNILKPWAWTAILLLVVCLPRVTIDAYLPSLPAMADALHATDAQMQLTLTLYMVGYAVSMLICGPLCDRVGRRPVLIWGTLLYVAATIVCAMANNAAVIIVARMFQALGGCSGTVVGRVMVRDKFDKTVQAGMLSQISMGMALSPIIAPLIGSMIHTLLGWRWVFIGLGLLGIISLALIALLLPETRPAAQADAPRESALSIYRRLLGDAYFLRYALAISFVYCTYFPFIAESSVLLQRTMHLSETAYALVFGVTVAGYVIGSNLFRRLSARYPADRLISWAVGVNITGAMLLMGATTFYPLALPAIVAPFILIMLSVGVAIPACQFGVLQPYAAVAGSASGLFFFIQMALTALCSFITSCLSNGTARPMVLVTVACSVGFGAVWFGFRRQAQQVSARASHLA
ncbi:multidrug effflux MFS transporter [Janthinobacterium agaricidamnosum]|uniref:Bcr/CflA family efflux transporter n=1 Tax=Janthinobacterium agaricidamnosum NBRC 102515 = DSM 9628 TaxID=1349767 RepID=W0VB91_9BURK|nr:multidrug effflux MFS transporter [Janthinobacterium agaricidamnosum]CDG85146.1 drug resistance transporter, Bcr/CflA subfamily protein [Janthinobacterium agaricidamnosum NBRC 102515 = DSM 9628]